MLTIIELHNGARGRRKGKENNRESTILKYVMSGQVEALLICTETAK
jgi:hypothetical protein